MQMALGKDVAEKFTSPRACVEEISFSKPLKSVLMELFRADPKGRGKAFDLTSYSFIHSDRGPLMAATSRIAQTQVTPFRRSRHDSSQMLPMQSRYEADWIEAGRLGKGGYGEVVKARNRTDGQFYAIKKIKSGFRAWTTRSHCRSKGIVQAVSHQHCSLLWCVGRNRANE